MTIMSHGPREEYRVDILIGDRQVASAHFVATPAEVSATAQRIVSAQGGDYGDVYQHNGVGGGIYYETVAVA